MKIWCVFRVEGGATTNLMGLFLSEESAVEYARLFSFQVKIEDWEAK